MVANHVCDYRIILEANTFTPSKAYFTMRFSLIVAMVALATAAAGCATTASDPSFSHKNVPTERVLFLPEAPIETKPATIEVMRDYQFKGAALTTTLTFNGKDLALINTGEKIIFRVTPDEHLLGLKFYGNDPVLGALTFGIARPKRFIETATRFESGKNYIFRIVDNANWEWELKRSSY